MKHNTLKNSMISMLSVCILLLLSSQAVYAAKPVKVLAAPTTVINSVVVDIASSNIVVTGTGLDTITEVTLGGFTIPFDGSTGFIDFTDIDVAVTAVLTAGNYSLVVGDNIFSVYLSSTDAAAITPPTPPTPGDYTACPCHADWILFGANYDDPYGDPYLGFDGGTGTYLIDTPSEVDVWIESGA